MLDYLALMLNVELTGGEFDVQAVVTGAEINPRKVKTFINDVNLQWAMLKNSGQAQGINRDDFTRWQVLMRAAPPNFAKRVHDIDDVDLRHKFIGDALKWAQGEAEFGRHVPRLRTVAALASHAERDQSL